MYFLFIYDYLNKHTECLKIDESYFNIRQYMELYSQNYLTLLIEKAIKNNYTADYKNFYNKGLYPIKKHIGDGIFYIEKQGANYDKLLIKLITKNYGFFYNTFNFQKLLRLQIAYIKNNKIEDDKPYITFFDCVNEYNNVVQELKEKFNDDLFIECYEN